MNEPSSGEHLAPVAYLPWAVPADESPVDRSDARETNRRHPSGSRRFASVPDGVDDAGEPESDVSSTDGRRGSDRRARTGSARDGSARAASGWSGSGRSGSGRSGSGRAGSTRAGADDGRPRLEIAEAPGPERDARIDRIVVNRLRRSSLSVAEVRRVLVEHGLDDAEADEWLERYERLGYLDDARLAEHVVHAQAVRRGRGSAAVIAELTRRGIDGEVVRDAIASLDPADEVEAAAAVARRRASQLDGLERHVAERRLSAFLGRRGYPGDVVREAVARALDERSAEHPPS